MVNTKYTADEVRKTECYWGDYYQGTAEALVNAGLVEMHMLPGQPGRNKVSITFDRRRDEVEGISKITKQGRIYTVFVRVSKEERDRREAQQALLNQKAVEATERSNVVSFNAYRKRASNGGPMPEKVIKARNPHQNEIIDCLKQLLARAECGEINGLTFCAHQSNGECCIEARGEMESYPQVIDAIIDSIT